MACDKGTCEGANALYEGLDLIRSRLNMENIEDASAHDLWGLAHEVSVVATVAMDTHDALMKSKAKEEE